MDQTVANKIVQLAGSTRNAQVDTDKTAVWANSAPANTQVNVAIAQPTTPQKNGKYLVNVRNPSTVTALTVKVRNTLAAFGGAAREAELTSIAVPANSIKSVLVEGWLAGGGGSLLLSNDTVLGAADGFTADIRVVAP